MSHWSKPLSAGIESIDKQHKKLVAIIDALDDAIIEGKSRRVMKNILKELREYTDYHFSCEGELLVQCGCHNTEHHRQDHAVFTARFVELKTKLDAGNYVIGWDLMVLLTGWLFNHIIKSDRELAPFA